MERKKLIEIIGSVFVALIFLSSYAAFGGRNGNGQSGGQTTTTAAPRTVPLFGSAKASLSSYGPTLTATIVCHNTSSVSTKINDLLTALQNNNSVTFFYFPQDNQAIVQNGTKSAYDVYNSLSSGLGQSASCVNFSASKAVFQVPAILKLSGITVQIPARLRSCVLPVRLPSGVNTTISVALHTLVDSVNGTVYDVQANGQECGLS